MSRVKRGVTAHAKHKKTLRAAKGYFGRRKNTIRVAKQAAPDLGHDAPIAAFVDKLLSRAGIDLNLAALSPRAKVASGAAEQYGTSRQYACHRGPYFSAQRASSSRSRGKSSTT